MINSGLSGGALRPRQSPQCAENEGEPPPCAEADLGDGRQGLAGLPKMPSIIVHPQCHRHPVNKYDQGLSGLQRGPDCWRLVKTLVGLESIFYFV